MDDGFYAPPAADPAAWVAPRHGYLPPIALVVRLREADWDRSPPVGPFTDLAGEVMSERVLARMAWDDAALWLDAVVAGSPGSLRPDLPPDSPDFWLQDHLEWRWLCGERQVQLILAPDGRWWGNQPWWQTAVTVEHQSHEDSWRIRARLDFASTDLSPPRAGDVWRGLIAHTRWVDGAPDIVATGAVVLGFSQSERFGEWHLVEDPPAPGEGDVVCESADRGEQSGTAPFPAYTRYRFRGREQALGAATSRPPAPKPRWRSPILSGAHPYLLFDEAALAELRAKLRLPFFARLAGETVADSGEPVAADAEESPTFDFTPRCANWFRVARETMLRDGAGNRTPHAAHIWASQSATAQQAWRRIVDHVTPAPEELAVVLDELNRLLGCPDFHTPDAFGRVPLPLEARELLAQGLGNLSKSTLRRFNRILLQSSVECIGNYRMDLVQRPGSLWQTWLATGDERLIHAATASVRAALKLTILDYQIHLHEGMAAGGLALAYDSFYPHLDDSARQDWESLLERFLRLYLDTARVRSWTVTTIANANPVGNGGCGLAALALRPSHSDLADQVLAYVRSYLWHWLDYCHGPDGGNTEGAQYWAYGMDHFLRFATAWERLAGDPDHFLAQPAVAGALNMIRVGLCNDGAMSGVNDTVPMPVGGAIAWWLAGRSGDPLALWYGDHAARWLARRRQDGKPAVYGASLAELLIYRPAAPEALDAPPLPTAVALPNIEVGLLRSSPSWDCVWDAGLKGARPPFTHHAQADCGSVFVDLCGERLIIDPGYYKGEVTDHALPLLDGRGPQSTAGWIGRLTDPVEQGDIRYLAVVATPAYAGRAGRVIRHLLIVGEEAVIILDDIETPARVTSQWPCGGSTCRAGATVTVSGDRVHMSIDFHVSHGEEPRLHPERSLHDTHWGYHFADCRLFPVTLDYAAASGPLVTVCRHATASPSIVHRTPSTLTIVLPSTRTIDWRQTLGGWRPRLG